MEYFTFQDWMDFTYEIISEPDEWFFIEFEGQEPIMKPFGFIGPIQSHKPP